MATITKPVALDETLQRVADAVEEMAQVDSVIDDSIVANNATWSSEKIDDKFSQQSQSLTEKATNPVNPVVGQWGRVASIDEDGQPVWETAELPIATQSKYGLVSLYANSTSYGIAIENGRMRTFPADNTSIRQRLSNYRPITPNSLAYAVKSAMSAAISTNDPAWTSTEQAAAQQRIGIVTLTQEEYDLLETKGESTIYIIVEAAT